MAICPVPFVLFQPLLSAYQVFLGTLGGGAT